MKKFIFMLSFIFSFSSSAGCYDKVDLTSIGSDEPAYRCQDGTVSFAQATRYSDRKSKKDDYESLCGAVATANVFHAYCHNLFVNHVKIAEKYFNDITPGIRPDTLKAGLNKMFENNKECMSGEWKYYYSTNRWNFLNSLYFEVRRGNGYWTRKINDVVKAKRSPLIVLISKKNDAKILHYVTVVDIIGYDPKVQDYKSDECKVIYNDFGSQTSKSCSQFVKYANQVNNQFFTSILNEYTHIVFEPSYNIKKAARRVERITSGRVGRKAIKGSTLKSIKDIHTRK